MKVSRILSALGGSYSLRIARHAMMEPRSVYGWAQRRRIPPRHRHAVEAALQGHAVEVIGTLAELRGETIRETFDRLVGEEVSP